MPNFVLKLPVMSNRDLPIISDDDLSFSTLTIEPDAWDHWELDASPMQLVGKTNNRSLTVQGAVTNNVGTVSMFLGGNSGGKNALVSGFADSHLQTQMAIIKFSTYDPSSTIPVLFGALTPSGAGSAGSAAFLAVQTLRRVFTPRGTAVDEQPKSEIVDKWVMVVLAESSNDTSRSSSLFVSGTSTPYYREISDNANGKILAPVNISAGNVAYSDAGTGVVSVEYAEYGIWDKMLSEAEINSLYVRAKARMAARGLQLS
ncbi:hypothetical protein ACOIES_21680 [Klebsiella pneumoniae]|uniref:hypothetical protein n=1 Tax=Klebsiella pneumoniae TaxID=573 RepID=UPI0025A6E3DD|nr:hypothetical protein [Klebsiella pneumoniae]EKW1794143.1 hypothetical protein [Klebsiella pneumoniae]ELO8754491.1 hypothetical protein [Klebsiella pneumoniae]HBY4457174.1 hypothetical protein [Klebsiella pneumoniae]